MSITSCKSLKSLKDIPRFLCYDCRYLLCQVFYFLLYRIQLTHIPIDLHAVSCLSFRRHLPGRHALVDRRDLLYNVKTLRPLLFRLPCIAAVVDLLIRRQILIACFRPGLTPLFRLRMVVPVVARDADTQP